MKRWCVIDANYLCRRAYYAVGELQFGDAYTGVIFGFLRDIISLQDRFQPQCMIFCFDYGRSLRYDMCDGYKSTRKKRMQEEDLEMEIHFQAQVGNLRRKYLKSLGYKNIFFHKGYEGDDCIARVVQSYDNVHHIIISSDNDFYQLLGTRVSIYNPRDQSITTERSFSKCWGVSPTQWIDVKAIAGCKSDDIPGIQGVGEKTAVKFLTGRLNPKSKAYQKIVSGNQTWKNNISLVELPLAGIQDFQVRTNEKISAQSWEELAAQLGFKTLMGNHPKRKGFDLG